MLIMLFLLMKIKLCSYKIDTKYLLSPFFMLFIHSYKNSFLVQFFYIIILNSSNFDNHSKTSAFEKFIRLLYKYYPRFSKISTFISVSCSLIWLRAKLKTLYEHWHASKNVNESQLGTVKNPTADICSEATKL